MKSQILEADAAHRLERSIDNFFRQKNIGKNDVKFVSYHSRQDDRGHINSAVYSVLILYEPKTKKNTY